MGACNSCSPQASSDLPQTLPVLQVDQSVSEVRTIGRGVSRRGSTFVQAAEITDKPLPTGVTTGMHTVAPLRDGFDPTMLPEQIKKDPASSPRLQRQVSKRAGGVLPPPMEMHDEYDDRPSLGNSRPSERSLKRQPTKIDFQDDLPIETPEELKPLAFDLASPRMSEETLELHGVVRKINESEQRVAGIEDEGQCLELLSSNKTDSSQLLLVRGILLSPKWENNEAVMLAGYDEFLRLSADPGLIDWMAEWGLVLELIDVIINPVFGHLKSALVQEKFCAVLAMLCERLGDEGVLQLNKSIHSLIMALRYHQRSFGVQHYGLVALASVVKGDSNAESQTNQFLVAAKGGIELVCDAMCYYCVGGPRSYKVPTEETMTDAPSPAPSREDIQGLQTAGVAALCVFSNNISFHQQLIDAHAVECVLEAVRHHGDCLALKIRSLVFIFNMCQKGDDPEVIRSIWKGTGFPLTKLLAENLEERDLDQGMKEELQVVRESIATTLGGSS